MGEGIVAYLPTLYEIAKDCLLLGAAYLWTKIEERFTNGWLTIGTGGILLIYALSETFNG